MSILLGSEKLSAGTSRIGELISWGVLFVLVGALLGGWLATQRLAAEWQPRDWHAAEAYILRSHGWQWDQWPLNPDDLLSIKQRQRGVRATRDPRVLDTYVSRRWRESYHGVIVRIGWWTAGGALFSLLLFVWAAWELGRRARRHDVRRGARMAERAEVERLARKRYGKLQWRLASLRIASAMTYRHTLILGSIGSGKSQLIADILDQIHARDERALIYDPGGEFLSVYGRDCDHLLNPFDARSSAWSVLAEVKEDWDARAIANSLVPEERGQNQFFAEAARLVLAEAILRAKDQGLSMRQMYERLAGDASSVSEWLAGTPAATVVSPHAKAQAQGVLSQLANHLAALRYCPDGDFSVRRWVRNGKGNLYLSTREDSFQALRPLLSLWIELAAIELLSRDSRSGQRLWVIVDETASLQKLESLMRLLAQGRKYRVAAVLATQNPSQLREIYGREGAASMMGTIGNRVVYRLEDDVDAEAASRFFGAREVDVRRMSHNMGQRQQGSNINEAKEEERIVLPSEIQALPDLHCLIKPAGGLPACRGRTRYKDRPRRHKPFVPRKIVSRNFVKSEPSEAEPPAKPEETKPAKPSDDDIYKGFDELF